GERRRELPRLQHERRVPRRDKPGHPGGPAQHVAELARDGERLLVLRDDHVGEVPEVLRRPRRLPLRLGDRQPGVEGLKRRRARRAPRPPPRVWGGPRRGPPPRARAGPRGGPPPPPPPPPGRRPRPGGPRPARTPGWTPGRPRRTAPRGRSARAARR